MIGLGLAFVEVVVVIAGLLGFGGRLLGFAGSVRGGGGDGGFGLEVDGAGVDAAVGIVGCLLGRVAAVVFQHLVFYEEALAADLDGAALILATVHPRAACVYQGLVHAEDVLVVGAV